LLISNFEQLFTSRSGVFEACSTAFDIEKKPTEKILENDLFNSFDTPCFLIAEPQTPGAVEYELFA